MDQGSGKLASRFNLDLKKSPLASNLKDTKQVVGWFFIYIWQDCAGESQSPIDVEWPENSMANALPGPLTFEGYDRVRRSILHQQHCPRLTNFKKHVHHACPVHLAFLFIDQIDDL